MATDNNKSACSETSTRQHIKMHIKLTAANLSGVALPALVNRFSELLPAGIDTEWTPLHGLWMIQVMRFDDDFFWLVEKGLVPMLDLRGANLAGACLFGAWLPEVNLEGANLEGADLRDSNLYGANLTGANLCGTKLYGADLREAKY